MFSIYDGRKQFYQWDTGRKLIINDKTITEVHFANCLCSDARKCIPYTIGDLLVVDVPNELLTEYQDIRVWGYDSGMTKHDAVFEVEKRTKPADYIYTPEELKTWELLVEQIDALEQRVFMLETGGKVIFYIFDDKRETELGTTWHEYLPGAERIRDDYCEACGEEGMTDEIYFPGEEDEVIIQCWCGNCESIRLYHINSIESTKPVSSSEEIINGMEYVLVGV